MDQLTRGAPVLRFLRGAVAVLTLTAAGVWAQTAAQPTIIEVQVGDTFSGIAARVQGESSSWLRLYRPQLTGLRDPNVILVGQRFEVATDSKGTKYLRLLAPGDTHAAAVPPAPTPAPAPRVAAVPVPPAPPQSLAAKTAAASVPAPPQPAAASAVEETSLVIGVLPNIGPAALAAQYESLSRYLERVAGQNVKIVVPANFKTFLDRTMAGEFDLAVAAPHFVRIAQLDRNMLPLVTYEPRINALFIAPTDAAVSGPRDVRERTVGFANQQSLVAMYGQQWLRQQNMEAGRDYQVKAARTDLGVGRMLLTGEAVAAVMSNGEFRALPADESARLKIVEVFARVPNFVFLAHPRIERGRLAKLKAHLKGFLADKTDGAAFAQATGFTAIIDVDDAMLRELDPYVGMTRQAMGYVK